MTELTGLSPVRLPSLRSSRGGEAVGEVGRNVRKLWYQRNQWREVFQEGEKRSVMWNAAERLCEMRTDQFYVQLSFLILASLYSPGFSSSSSPTLSPSWAPDVNPKVLPFFFTFANVPLLTLCHSLAYPTDSGLTALALPWSPDVLLTLPGTSFPAFLLCSVMATNWSWKSGQKYPQPRANISSPLSFQVRSLSSVIMTLPWLFLIVFLLNRVDCLVLFSRLFS